MGYKLDTRELDKILSKLNGNANTICRRAAFSIKQKWHLTAVTGETGALNASCYVATQDESGYSEVSAQARTLNPKARTEEHPKPTGHIKAVVGPCVDYAEYVELGTYKMAGRPYLKNAAEATTREFVEMWKEGLFK